MMKIGRTRRKTIAKKKTRKQHKVEKGGRKTNRLMTKKLKKSLEHEWKNEK